MHIEKMHTMIEKLVMCAENELEKGIENVDANEMMMVTDMIKDLTDAEYHATITKAMKHPEEYNSDIMNMIRV